MQICKLMEIEITRIAGKFGLDLKASQSHLRLQNRGYMDLVIEKIGPREISVCHYVEINGDQCQDPEMTFFFHQAGWVPLMIQQLPFMLFGKEMGGYRVCAELNDKGTALKSMMPVAMKEMATFARMWSKNILEQGFYDYGVPKVYTTIGQEVR